MFVTPLSEYFTHTKPPLGFCPQMNSCTSSSTLCYQNNKLSIRMKTSYEKKKGQSNILWNISPQHNIANKHCEATDSTERETSITVMCVNKRDPSRKHRALCSDHSAMATFSWCWSSIFRLVRIGWYLNISTLVLQPLHVLNLKWPWNFSRIQGTNIFLSSA